MASRESRDTDHQDGPGGQRDWYEKPAGKIVLGIVSAIISGLLLWFITDRILSQRDTPAPLVIEVPARGEPKEEKAMQPDLAKPRRPAVQRREERKERDAPAKPDPP